MPAVKRTGEREDAMNKLFGICASGVLAVGLAGLLVTGCKQPSDFTGDQALALIQARYDQQPPVNATVMVNDDGMKAGVLAKYWDRSKAYPNRYWADFKLSSEGRKAVKLADGGDTIAWHPDSPADPRYKIAVVALATNHLKAANASEPQNGAGGTKAVIYDEVTSLKGAPDPVQKMARDSHTVLTTRRTATFVKDSGAWKLQSIE